MTDLNLTHLKQIAQNATQGEWSIEPSTVRYLDGRTAPTHEIVCTRQSQADPSDTDWETVIDDVESEPDAAHIAAFDPPTALALIARIEHLEAAIQRIRDLHQNEDGHCVRCSEDYGLTVGTYPCPPIRAIEGDQR